MCLPQRLKSTFLGIFFDIESRRLRRSRICSPKMLNLTLGQYSCDHNYTHIHLTIYLFLAHCAQTSDESGDRRKSSMSQKSHHSKLTRRSQTVSVPEKIDLQDRKNNGYNGLSFNDLHVSNLAGHKPENSSVWAWEKSHWCFRLDVFFSF